MATITQQRELVLELKKETFLNIGILSKLQPMSTELSRLVFQENALEKPTQNLLNHLSFYLVSIIDSQFSNSLSWPLYDSKTERTFRNELSNFINDYSSKGLLSPVMSSYLVNPSSLKVQKLFFQLSQLAVQKVLTTKMKKESEKQLFNDMTEKYKSNKREGFLEEIETETERKLSTFSSYLQKRKITEKIAELLRAKITEMEDTLTSTNATEYINNIVDDYVKTHTDLNDEMKSQILSIKNVNQPSKFFDDWLSHVDEVVNVMEETWIAKTKPFLDLSRGTFDNTKSLISRHTGETDKNMYMIEYNPKIDEICTIDLQKQVNSEQKYILKNIVKDDKLNFTNLVRGFLIAVSFILKNTEIDSEIYNFNECLEEGSRSYEEIVFAMKELVERVVNAEANLQASSESSIFSISPTYKPLKPVIEIPAIPDLSDLKSNRNIQYLISFDTFTPMNTTKHQFNLMRKSSLAFTKPLSKSLFVTPFSKAPRDDFMKSISYQVCPYDRLDLTQNFHNMSVLPQSSKLNETIAECSGFTKQQLMRILSTRKSSSSKKFKYSTQRPEIRVVKGGLFNESNTSNESSGLFRSYSSPNLFESKEKKFFPVTSRRKLSIMQEDYPLLEVSGIAALNNNDSTPQGHAESSRKLQESFNCPVITITPCREAKINNVLHEMDMELDLRGEREELQAKSIESSRKLQESFNCPVITITPCREAKINNVLHEMDMELDLRGEKEELQAKSIEKTKTPKINPPIVRKTSSLEKIINRFKKVRASVLPGDNNTQDVNDFMTIAEERESVVVVDSFTANKFILPDLVSPSCSILTQNSDYLDQIVMDIDKKNMKKPRESLGTALGVDNTFLDQCDFID